MTHILDGAIHLMHDHLIVDDQRKVLRLHLNLLDPTVDLPLPKIHIVDLVLEVEEEQAEINDLDLTLQSDNAALDGDGVGHRPGSQVHHGLVNLTEDRED